LNLALFYKGANNSGGLTCKAVKLHYPQKIGQARDLNPYPIGPPMERNHNVEPGQLH